MPDNPVHNGTLRDEGDDLHSAATLGQLASCGELQYLAAGELQYLIVV